MTAGSIQRLRASLPARSAILTWRTFFFILAFLNLKSLPLAWHFRLLRRFWANITRVPDVRRAIQKHADASSSGTSVGSTHPIFTFHTHTSFSPLYETDYNIHKSNSTYFSDLDESRMGLCTRILIPGIWSKDRSLEKQGIKGKIGVYLGAVHCTFHREIKPYQSFEVRSRVLGWDRKWLVIVSFFVLPAKGKKEEVLLASALSKYVIKKGRFTVSPDHCLRVAGWLPPKPEQTVDESGVLVPQPPSVTETGAEGTPLESSQPVTNASASTVVAVEEVKEKLEKVLSRGQEPASDPIISAARTPEETSPKGWDWHRIEQERLRGLKLAEAWLALDANLKDEHAHSSSML
jgi:acyl-CoA thioesterase FadM